MAYDLKGSLLEVCDCDVLCPCWVGEDPDNDSCEAIVAWHIDRGAIDGVDVSGLTLATFAHIPGNVLSPETWKVARFVDDRASERQQEALLPVWTGRQGGPVGELVKVVGEVASPKRAPALGRDGGAGAASRTACPLVLTALIVVAWAQLSLWSLSPYARYLDHRALEELPLRLAARYLALLGLSVLGWLLMSVATMLPTSLPLVRTFQRVVARRPDRGRLVALLVVGDLAVWTLVGLLAHLGDLGVHQAVHRLAWLERRAWLVETATLAVAGAVQLSPLKHACLARCRAPLSFVAERWGRGAPRRDAVALGMRHGLFCVGCCWPLMLVMFAFACGNVGWMAGLGAVMAVEKNAAWGRRLTAPIGAALLIAAAATAVAGAGRLPA